MALISMNVSVKMAFLIKICGYIGDDTHKVAKLQMHDNKMSKEKNMVEIGEEY